MIEKILGSKTKVKILRKMLEQNREFWFNDISKLANLSLGTVHPVLNELVGSRILKVRKAGNSTLYSLNKSHFLYPEIEKLFQAEEKIPERAAKEFAKKISKGRIKNIILFGSLARGEFGGKSDVDILIIYRGSKERIKERSGEAAREILEKYDLVVSTTYLSEKDAEERLKRLDNFIIKALDEGKILYGDSKWLKK